jgi:hypothetical protein
MPFAKHRRDRQSLLSAEIRVKSMATAVLDANHVGDLAELLDSSLRKYEEQASPGEINAEGVNVKQASDARFA